MNRKKFAIGVDVGGSHLCSAVVDLDRKVLCSAPVLTPMDSSGPAEEILACFKKNLLGTMETFGKNVNRIGLAFPGPFDYEKGIPYMDQKFQKLYGMDMPKELRKQLDSPRTSFKFINDASAFALGECFCGSGRDRKRVIALTLGRAWDPDSSRTASWMSTPIACRKAVRSGTCPSRIPSWMPASPPAGS